MTSQQETNLDKLFKTVPKRKFSWMKTVDMYIFKEFMIVYVCLNLAFCTLFLISDMINKLGDFSGTGTPIWRIAYYFLLKQPGDIKFVLPIALLLSCMYAMAKLGMHNEITAMRACGISLIRIGVPIYIIGLLVSGFNFWFNESLVPSCNMTAEMIRKTASDPHYYQNKARMLTYRSPDDKRTWLIRSFSQDFKTQYQVQVKIYDKEGNLSDELYAGHSTYSPEKGWIFYDVSLIKYRFVRLINDYNKETKGQTQELVVPSTTKFKVFGPDNKDYKILGDIFETPNDMRMGLKDPDQITSGDIVRKLTMSKNLDAGTMNPLKTELYTRFAFPWVCILSVFLGVPMAVSNERKGIMISVVTAIGIIVIYQIFSQMFQILGNRGVLPPVIAGTAPTIALALYVMYIMKKIK